MTASAVISPSPASVLTPAEVVAAIEKRISALEQKLTALAAKSDAKVIAIEKGGGLEKRLGVHRVTIFRWVRDGNFPPPVYHGSRRVWRIEDVAAWERAQAEKPHVKAPRGIAARKAREEGKPC